MTSIGVKGVGAAIIVWLTYLNNMFSPLLWVLIALIFIDLLLNVHHEGKQFQKIGSMVATLGIPAYVAQNLSTPGVDLPKYLVAMLCLVYLQIVYPQLRDKIKTFQFSKNKETNATDQALVDKILQQLAAQESAAAKKEAADAIKSADNVSTGAQAVPVVNTDTTKGA